MQTTRPVTKPSTQRKMVFKAPAHVRYKLFSAHLSPELKASHGVNSLPVRRGDTVRIMRGDNKGFEGKISNVNRRKYKVFVEGLTREKVDGTAIFIPVHPSKVMITHLNLDDKWRRKILERKKAMPEKVEETKVKPVKKEVLEAKEEIVEEKPTERPKRRRKKAPAKKPTSKKAEEKPEEAKTKAKKPRARRKAKKKTEEGT
jgi:large subunit ribosomal protein L24